MNESFYASVLRHPPLSRSDAIFDDKENIIWIDWRETEDAIVEYICERIGSSDIRAVVADDENEWGYTVTIMRGNESRVISPESVLDARHATLNALDELLSPVFQIRFVADTNGADTMGVMIERVEDWSALYRKHGRRVNEHFCPIRELPDLLETPGDEIDQACADYANRIG